MRRIPVLLAVFVALGGSPKAQGQEREAGATVLGVVSSIPSQPIGIDMFWLKVRRLGYYFAIKTGVNDRSGRGDYFGSLSRHEVEDLLGSTLVDTSDNWISLSGGPTTRLMKGVYGYLGIGVAVKSAFRQYDDANGALGFGGTFWIKDGDHFTVTGSAGLEIRAGRRIWLNVGGDVNPANATVGIGWAF
jgi:hypothetical protein